MQVSGAAPAGDLFASSQLQQQRNDVTALTQALGSGDLAGAQKAYAALQLSLGNGGSGHTGDSGLYGAVRSDFATLGQALQSGDLAGAQKIFGQLQKDVQNARPPHHHHHRHQGSGGGGGASVTAQSAFSIDLSVDALQYSAPGISVTEIDVSVDVAVGTSVNLKA